MSLQKIMDEAKLKNNTNSEQGLQKLTSNDANRQKERDFKTNQYYADLKAQ